MLPKIVEGDRIGVYTVLERSFKEGSKQPFFTLKCNYCGSIIYSCRGVLPRYRKENKCCCKSKIYRFTKCKENEKENKEFVGDVYGIYRIVKIYKDRHGEYLTRFVCLECGNTGVVPYKDGLKKYALDHPSCSCSNRVYIPEHSDNYKKYRRDLSQATYKSYIGKIIGCWEIIDSYTRETVRNKKDGTKKTEYLFRVKCTVCGKERSHRSHLFIKGKQPICNHHFSNKYFVKDYKNKLGTIIQDFYIYDLSALDRKINGATYYSYYYKCLCTKCGKSKVVSCYSLLTNNFLGLKHYCKPYKYKVSKGSRVCNFVRGNPNIYDKTGVENYSINCKDCLDLRYNYLSEYSCLYGTELFMESIAQASIDGKLEKLNNSFCIEDIFPSKKFMDNDEVVQKQNYPKSDTVWYNKDGKKRIRHFRKWKHGKRSYKAKSN